MKYFKFSIIIPWISVAFAVGYFVILAKELIFEDLYLSEISIVPIILGIILIADLIFSISVLKQKSKPYRITVIFQILNIFYILYLIYYYNGGMSVKVDRSINY